MEKGLPWLGVEPSQPRGAAPAEGKAETNQEHSKALVPSDLAPGV